MLGTDAFERYLEKYGLYLQADNAALLERYVTCAVASQPVCSCCGVSYPKQAWARFVNNENRANMSNEVVDLLDRLLRYDHCERLTAAEALSHAFFSECEPTVGRERVL